LDGAEIDIVDERNNLEGHEKLKAGRHSELAADHVDVDALSEESGSQLHQRNQNGRQRVLKHVLRHVAHLHLGFLLVQLLPSLHEFDPLWNQLPAPGQLVNLLLYFKNVVRAQARLQLF
jgi:hypothetical protein